MDAAAKQQGLIGIVRTVFQSPDGPGAIAFNVYRDLTAAEAALNTSVSRSPSRIPASTPCAIMSTEASIV